MHGTANVDYRTKALVTGMEHENLMNRRGSSTNPQ
jgi:hypothetical protein